MADRSKSTRGRPSSFCDPLVDRPAVSNDSSQHAKDDRCTLDLLIQRSKSKNIDRFPGVNPPLTDATFRFLLAAQRGVLLPDDLSADARTHTSIDEMLFLCASKNLAEQRKALLALSVVCHSPIRLVAQHPVASVATLYRWRQIFLTSGLDALMRFGSRKGLREEDPDLQSAIFRIMHEPPTLHGFHRTKWRQVDLLAALRNRGVRVSVAMIRRLLQKHQTQRNKISSANHNPATSFPSTDETFSLLRSAHQGTLLASDLPSDAKRHASIGTILAACKSNKLIRRNKAMLALSVVCHLPLRHLARYPVAATATLYRWRHTFLTSGLDGLLRLGTRNKLRQHDPDLQSAIFRIMHEPPSLHGFHRTNWRQVDLHAALRNNGIRVSIWTIRRVIHSNKYQWRHAKVVLTSNDPDYRAKVAHIKEILASLGDDECFFSIDEYGPFTVRFMRGKRLCAPGEIPSVPQWQKSRGTLIFIGALELKSNQVTHFYSDAKNTTEMIKMVELLRRKYVKAKKLYISWDAAGWHMSKALGLRVSHLNEWAHYDCAPFIELAPLPSRAQFLNVIESVFSGMSRAVIHNSNFGDVDEAKKAIDQYFSSRNAHFTAHPKRAGRTIWKHEKCSPEFRDDNNCKDERYR